MTSNHATVSDIFRRAQEIKSSNSSISYNDLKARIVSEFEGKPFPDANKLAIPEFDNIAPEEDWSAGLPLVLRGIQTENWKEIASGIVLSLEQIENFPKESLREDAPEKEWHNRNIGIEEAEKKNFDKWMPEELMALARNNSKN